MKTFTMWIIIIDPFGGAKLQPANFIPPIGSQIDLHFGSPCRVLTVLCWPNSETMATLRKAFKEQDRSSEELQNLEKIEAVVCVDLPGR